MNDRSTIENELGPQALAGLRVLDLTQSLAGPYSTQMLSDLGATVIKIESPSHGDMTRHGGPYHSADEARAHAGYFHSVNRNKKGLAVDLKSAEGKAVFLRLVRECDLVVENFRVGTMDGLGLSYETLAQENEALVYAALRGFGDPRSGVSPYVKWPAFDVVAQAMGGVCGITGPSADAPTKIGPGIGDLIPGLFLTIGILAAVIEQKRTGKGQFVDVGMVDCILSVCERIVYQRSFAEVTPKPQGNHQPFLAPFGIYPAANGHVAIAAPSDDFFGKLCGLLDEPGLADDPRFATREGRRRNLADLIAAVSDVTRRYTTAELSERLGGAVPFGPVYDVDDIMQDEHFKVRNMLPTIEIPGVDTPLAIAGQPIKMSRHKDESFVRGPTLGEDTAAVLAWAGYSPQEVAELRSSGAVK